MSFTNWLRNLRSALTLRPAESTHRRQRSLRAKTHRLGLEVLEDRSLPSTFTVLNLLDTGTGSLRAAVAAANANAGADVIDFAVSGTIGLTSGQLDVTDSVTINGPGTGALTVDGAGRSRVFAIAGTPTVTIANLTVTNGRTYGSPGGGISMAGGTLTLDRVAVSGNHASGVVGGSYGDGGDGAGGGIYVAGGTLTLDQCTVSGNIARGGAGSGEESGSISEVGGDGGDGAGGGLYVAGGTVVINQTTISENQAVGGMGGTPPWYLNHTVGGHGGMGEGGGIRVVAGSVEIRQSSIFENKAGGGDSGAGENYNGTPLPGAGLGGGLSIAPAAPPLVDLDTFTELNTSFNYADVYPNIAGPYTVSGSSNPTLTIRDVSTQEGNTGTHAVTFTVTLSAAYGQSVTVAYATANGTATAGSDYQAVSGTLTIPAGQTTGTITVLVDGDRLAEANETFSVNLSSPTNATIDDGQGVGTIVDDEPRISISDVTKSEGRRNKKTLFTFTVSLSTVYDQPVTMSYRTVDGTATTGNNDYVAKSGTLTFAPGETTKTITIEVKGDSKREANETFYLDLFGLSSNALFTKNRGVGTILNDD
jgi:hypothetical protein